MAKRSILCDGCSHPSGKEVCHGIKVCNSCELIQESFSDKNGEYVKYSIKTAPPHSEIKALKTIKLRSKTK